MKNKKETKKEETVSKAKRLVGIVTSDKMKDTIVVNVSRYAKHPKYGKFVNINKKYKAHDAGNTTNIGDKVEIIETRPISKDKHFKLLNIISKTESLTEDNK